MRLGCVMDNMWLVAESLGIGFQIQSALNADRVEGNVKQLLGIPAHVRIGFALRVGFVKAPAIYLRVRRDVEDLTHCKRFRQKRTSR
jgi:nitroreductase